MGIKERKEREKNARKASIVKAAMEVYVKEGYHAATMEKIAGAAELSRATLYLYFKTKDEIFVHAIVMQSQYFAGLLEELYSHRKEKGEKILEALWGCFKKLYQKDPVIFEATLYFHQAEMIRRLPKDLCQMLDVSGSHNYSWLCKIMEHGIRKGYYIECNPKTLAENVWTAFLGIIHLENSKRAMGRKNHYETTWDLGLKILELGTRKKQESP